MQIARELAGYSLGGADLLRRAMGKKIKAEMDAQREVFIEGAIARGIPQKLATAIFEQVAKFASYGFPKAHATAYALLAYQTAYLKANHPLEFFAAAMTMDRANQDKLTLYRQEIARVGIELRPPDVNHGDADFTVEDGAIRYALAAIRGVGVQAVEALVAERAAGGPFADLFDLAARAGARILNRRLLEALIKAGALDRLHANRRQALEAIDLALRYGAAHVEQATSDQASLFGSLMEQPELPKPRLPEVADLPELERLQQEFEALGCYLTAHPLEGYRAGLARLGVTPSDQLALAAASGSSSPAWCSASRSAARRARASPSSSCRIRAASTRSRCSPSCSAGCASCSRAISRSWSRATCGSTATWSRSRRSSVEALDAALANGGRRSTAGSRSASPMPRRRGGLADLLGPHGDGSARVRVVLPLDAGRGGRDRARRRPPPRAGAPDRPRAPGGRGQRGRPLAASGRAPPGLPKRAGRLI